MLGQENDFWERPCLFPLTDFPDLEPEDIRAAIAYAARYLDHAVLVSS